MSKHFFQILDFFSLLHFYSASDLIWRQSKRCLRAATLLLTGLLYSLLSFAADENQTQVPNSVNVENFASVQVQNALNGQLGQWINQFGTGKIDVQMDNQFEFRSAQGTLLLSLDETADRLIFSQTSFHFDEDDSAINLGLGQRHYFDHSMLGYNLFFDQDLNESHSRLGLGTELARDYVKFTANSYIGLTHWTHSNRSDFEGYESKVANGFDAKLTGYLPTYPQLGSSITYEQYFGDEVALFDDELQSDPSALSFSLLYTPIPLTTFKVEHTIGQNSLEETNVALQLNFALGVPIEKQLSPSNLLNLRTLTGSRYDIVDRNNEIVLQYRQKERLMIKLPNSVMGRGNEVINFDLKIDSTHSITSFEWDASEFETKGGEIQFNQGQWQLKLPDVTTSTPEVFHIGLIVTDSKGNQSNKAHMFVTVNQSPELFVTPPIATLPNIIEGQNNIFEVTIFAKDGTPQPNQSVLFTLKLPSTQDTSLSAVTDKNGVAKISFTPQKSGEAELIVNAGSSELSYQFTIIENAAKNALIGPLGLLVDKINSVANGQTNTLISVPITNESGEPISGYAVSLVISNPDGSESKQTAYTDNNGIAHFELTQTQAGKTLISLTIGDMTDKEEVTIEPDQSTAHIALPGISLSKTTVIAQSEDSFEVSVPVKDKFGNPIPNYSVTFEVLPAEGSLSPVQYIAQTDNNGIAKTKIKIDNIGNFEVSVNVNGDKQRQTVIASFDVNSLQFANSELSIQNDDLYANGISEAIIGVSVIDEFGNFAINQPVTFTLTPINSVTRSSTEVTLLTNEMGYAQFPIKQTKAGFYLVSVTINGVTQTAEIEFLADVNTVQFAKNSTLSISNPNGLIVGISEALGQLLITDENQNPISNYEVDIAVKNPDGSLNTIQGTSNENGIVNFIINQTQAGQTVVSSEVGGKRLSAVLDFAANRQTAGVLESNFTVSTTKAIADDTSKALFTTLVEDSFGNPIKGYAVNYTINSSLDQTSQQVVLTNDLGLAVLSITKSQVQIVSVSNQLIPDKILEVEFVVDLSTIIRPLNTGISVNKQEVIADGTDEAIFAITMVDGNTQPAVNYPVEFTISTSDGEIRTQTISTDEFGVASLSLTQSKATVTKVSVKSETSSSQQIVNFVADRNRAKVAESGITLTGQNLVANNIDTAIIRIPVSDLNNNPIGSYPVTVKVTSPDQIIQIMEGLTNTNGILELPIKQNQAGETQIEISVNDQKERLSIQFHPDLKTARIEATGMTVIKNNQIANGLQANQIRISVVDAYHNPIAGARVVLTGNPALILDENELLTDQMGIIVANIKTTKAASYLIQAAVNQMSANATITFVPGSVDVSRSELILTPTLIDTTPSSLTTLSVILRDKFGNVIRDANLGFGINLPSADFKLGQIIMLSDGSYTAKLNINRIHVKNNSLTVPISVKLNGNNIGLQKNLTVQRGYYLIPIGEIQDNRPISSAEMKTLFNKYESIRLFMINGRYAPQINLPTDAPIGSAIEITTNTDLVTRVFVNTSTIITISKNHTTYLKYYFDGSTWVSF